MPSLSDVKAIEQGLAFVGLRGLIDPPLEGIKPGILECKQASKQVVMITGDHPSIALAIARITGIVEAHERILTIPCMNCSSVCALLD